MKNVSRSSSANLQSEVVVSGGNGGHRQAGVGTTQLQNVDNDAKRDLLAALSSVQDNGMYGLEVGKLYALLNLRRLPKNALNHYVYLA